MNKIILIGLWAGLAMSCRSGNQFKTGDPMPAIHMLTADSLPFNSDQIAAGRYTVVMYFRTDCIHCQKETINILKAGPFLKDLNILFLTPKSVRDLKQYAVFYKLGDYPNIKALNDKQLDFFRYYKPTSIPFIVIYNRQNLLHRIYEGPVPVDSLKKLIADK
jgi:hypothetical protein